MPTPVKPITIAIKNSETTSVEEYCKVTNLTSGGTITGKFSSNDEFVATTANSGFTWSNGDTLSIELNGRLIGTASATISKGGVRTTVTTTADTASSAVDL